MNVQEFDYVIVGGGSAGCALAGRLSEDPGTSVCVLEAGGEDHSVFVRAPLGIIVMVPFGLMNSWHYFTTPQKGFNGRKGFQPRGKVLGGSSSINAMVYTRCNRNDYDGWAAAGNPGWSYADLLPLFKRAENSHCFSNNEYHGNSGPLHVSYLRSPSPANEAFRAACVEKGIPLNPDYNGATQFGISPTQATQYNGERWNAARAYLHANADRRNLTVLKGCHVRKVVFEGKTATGVELRRDGRVEQIRARKEVILSAGAFGSPQLLMLSGIGPKAHLQQHGIAVLHDLPGVGQNLQDHIDYVQSWTVPSHTASFGASPRGIGQIARAMFEWRRQRSGMVTSTIATAGAFFRSAPEVAVPDLQLVFVVALVDDHARKAHLGHGISCHVDVLRPYSRGTVGIRSSNPRVAPVIDPQFLSDERDLALLVQGWQMQQRILESKPFDPIRGKMLYPVRADDAAAMAQDIRNRADTQYHPVGSCKMGPDSDPMAVVDARLRVRGVRGLRVADASIMPTLIGGNTNAPSIMIGEKLADLLRSNA